MKTFKIYDVNLNQVVAEVKAESSAMICNPYSGPQYRHAETPSSMNPADAKVELVNNQIVVSEDQDLKAAREAAELAQAREAKLNRIRDLRAPKLAKVDQLVNIAYLNSWTASEKTELRNYRLALLDITEAYKADPVALDALDVSAIDWPEEPTEA
jgi:hypothetical protein